MAERRSLNELRAASARLTARYRAGDPPAAFSALDAAAYATVRAPATLAAASAVMREVASLCGSFEPRSLVDLGAGTGTACTAARTIWPSITDAHLYERSPEMITIGDAEGAWHRADISELEIPSADVVTAAYSLSELDPAVRERVVDRAWAATTGLLVVIEPGTPRGFATILGIREMLMTAGAHLVAPCPHTEACPMPEGKWCHFPVRLERSSTHRRVKGTELPFEDERFSYVAFSRVGGGRVPGRVVGHPRHPRRRVVLEVCGSAGTLRSVTVPRSSPGYREAKDLSWGSSFVAPP